MNLQDEKSYLYEMMRDITKERRKLVEMYYGLKERLDFINSMEQKGIEELSLDGYIDLFNKTQKETVINNIKRESEHIIDKIEKDNNIEESRISVNIKEEIKKEDAQKRKGRGKGIGVNKEKVYSAISEILKECGTPIALPKLHDSVNKKLDSNIKYDYLQNTLLRDAMAKNKKIQRASRGYYQYIL